MPGLEPERGIKAVDLAFDVEDRVDPRHRLQCDRRHIVGGLALADIALDVGKLKELPPGMAPAERAGDRTGITVAAIEVVVTAMGVGLKDAPPPGEMPVRVSHLPIAREVEQRGRRRTAREGPVVADIGPEPRGLRPAPGQERHRGVVAVQPLGGQDMGPDRRMDRLQRHGAGADLVSQGAQADLDTFLGVALDFTTFSATISSSVAAASSSSSCNSIWSIRRARRSDLWPYCSRRSLAISSRRCLIIASEVETTARVCASSLSAASARASEAASAARNLAISEAASDMAETYHAGIGKPMKIRPTKPICPAFAGRCVQRGLRQSIPSRR